MQYVNNDMDDQFRKAGEEYPLHTGQPDWNKLAAALDAAQPSEPTVQTEPQRNYWRYTLLLLLLPLGWLCNHYRHATGEDLVAIQQVPPAGTAHGEKVFSNNRKAPALTTTFEKGNKIEEPLNLNLQQPAAVNEGKRKTAIAKPATTKTATGTVFKINRASAQQTLIGAYNLSTSGNMGQDAENQGPTNSIGTLTAPVFSITPNLLHSAIYDRTQRALARNLPQKRVVTNAPVKAIYGGLWASGDLTTVHWQRTSKPGWQGGLLAGYRFANRWSLETGISLTRKFYYSEGDYYVSPYPVPPNNKLTQVDGRCTMLEIPLNIRFDITRNQQAAWYATAGISSYIMKREDYDLTYLYLSSGNYGEHSKSYRNASRNLFSVVQLSTGYSQQLNKGVALRIEPTLRLPLTGLGYGKLRFSSAGLQVGVTKDLWQGNPIKK